MKSSIFLVAIICASLLLSEVSCGGACTVGYRCVRKACRIACAGDAWSCYADVNGKFASCQKDADCSQYACNSCLNGKKGCVWIRLGY